jgi:hypothetical protein
LKHYIRNKATFVEIRIFQGALMSERQDSGASGFPLILLTLIITRPLHLSRVGKPHASG